MLFAKPKVLINIACALGGIVASFLAFSVHSPFYHDTKAAEPTQSPQAAQGSCGYSLIRGLHGGMSYPLLMIEPDCEAPAYQDLKGSLESYLDQSKMAGHISRASVYFRNLTSAEWIDIGTQENFHPGSLAKVPMLFAYLRKAAIEPAILKKVIKFDHVADGHVHKQTFNGKAIVEGNSYTVRELLDYMIGSSDNAATFLLNMDMGIDPYKKVFADLGLPVPVDRNHLMSTKEYSRFFIVLYNSTYLSEEMSQLACTILNNNEFNEGLLKNIPKNIKTIHKFGEAGDVTKNVHELHESAVVFLEGKPYLLTVMTQGNDKTLLPGVLSHISDMVYDYVSKSDKTNI